MIILFSFFVRGKIFENGIFYKHFNDKIISIDVSGTAKQTINGTLQYTKPEYSIYPWDKIYDWCSNIGTSYDQHPWIAYSLQNKIFKFNGYFVRCGCCYGGCCCEDDVYRCVDCCLYSWSLQISNDNKTWQEIHRVDKDDSMRRCNEKSYKLDKEYTAKYVRIIQNEPCPGWAPCLAINKFELFGTTQSEDGADDFISFHDDDDDVSIIGHISKNNRV